MKSFAQLAAVSLLTAGSIANVAFAQATGPAPSGSQAAPPPPASSAAPSPPPRPTTSPPPSNSAAPQGPLPPLPSQAPKYAPLPVAGEEPDTAPPEAAWSYAYPTGRWVYATDYGWFWVPNEAATTAVEGVPYVFLYTPTYGWTWYVSPWGIGPYHYGVWVVHPWRPIGWRGAWVAGPHVVVRLRARPGWHGGGHFRGHRRW
jgi:hypothetical protein